MAGVAKNRMIARMTNQVHYYVMIKLVSMLNLFVSNQEVEGKVEDDPEGKVKD